MTTLLGALCGAVIGLGLLVVVAELWRTTPRAEPRRRTAPMGWMFDRVVLRAAMGSGGLVVAWLATGWPVAGLLAAVAGVVGPSLSGVRSRRAAAVARIEGIAGWAEQLRDVMAAAGGIQEAIVATGPLAPVPIRDEVARLVRRLSVEHEPLRPALRAFADDVAHPLSDMVVTSLLLASDRQGRLGDLLGEVARSARLTATMRLRVEAARARTYVTSRLLVGVTLGIGSWLVLFRREFLAPFDSPAGQAMLLVIGGVFAGSVWLLHRMAEPFELGRLLSVDHEADLAKMGTAS